MMKRVLWVVVIVVAMAIVTLGLSGCCCCPPGGQTSSKVARNISAGAVRRETRQVELGDADRVEVTVQFGGGELDIEGDSDPLLNAKFVYNLDDLEPVIVYDVQDEQGRLEIRHKSDAIRLDRLATEMRNEWELRLGERVPLDLNLDIGASNGRIQLGGLRVEGLNLTAGAADVTVGFDEPNPERLTSLHVRSGAARLQLLELGNANLDELTFDGGLGTYTFDFQGEWQRSANVRIQAGASQVHLRVPRDIGVRVCPGDLRRGDYDGLEKEGDCYVNHLYDQSDITLDISLDLGLGKLDIRQTN